MKTKSCDKVSALTDYHKCPECNHYNAMMPNPDGSEVCRDCRYTILNAASYWADMCALGKTPCSRRARSDDNTCEHYPMDISYQLEKAEMSDAGPLRIKTGCPYCGEETIALTLGLNEATLYWCVMGHISVFDPDNLPYKAMHRNIYKIGGKDRDVT